MVHSENKHTRNTTMIATLAASLLALAACGSPNSLASGETPNSIPATETTEATETTATAGTAGPTGSPGTGSDSDRAALVKQLISDDTDLPIEDLEVNDPFRLEPSTCVLWSAWPNNVMDYPSVPVVFVDDDPASDVVVVAGSDEHMATVAQRCFIDQGLVPTTDIGVRLVQWFSWTVPPESLVLDWPRNEPIGTSQVAWEAPAVTPIENGFVVTVMATDTYGIDHDYRVTATLTATSDGAGQAVVDVEDL